IFQKLDDLVNFVFRLINARNIRKRNVRVFFRRDAVPAASEIAEHSCAAAVLPKLANEQEPDDAENQDPRYEQGGDAQPDIVAALIAVLDSPLTADFAQLGFER